VADELKHSSVGTTMTQAEFEAVGLHVCDSQAIGDLIYASSDTQLSRLGIGTANQVLITSGGVPTWSSTITSATLTTCSLGGTLTLNGQAFDAGSGYLEIETTGKVGLKMDGGIALGIAPIGYYQNYFAGNFLSDGASDRAVKTVYAGQLTGAVGDSNFLALTWYAGTIVTQGTNTNIGHIATVKINEPGITNNLASGGKPDVAASLYIASAPDEGDINAAIYVASGDLNMASGAIVVGAQTISDSSGNLASANGASFGPADATSFTVVNGIITAIS